MKTLEYDPKSADSIFQYSKKLINKTLREFIDDDELILNESKKGELGSLVEKYFFNLEVNNKSEADFKEAGLELKTTGVKKLTRGGYTPKERLVLGKIDYHAIAIENFHTSHLLDKIKFMLLLFYLYDNQKVSIDQTFIKNMLWKMSDKDYAIMRDDWETIVEKIRDGRAHELSESDTLYLSACTKGATSRDRTTQPFSKEAAKPRAFAFKQSYLKTIFDSDKSDNYDSILANTHELNINNYVANKLDKYNGRTLSSLYVEFGNGLNIKSKNIKQLLVYRMLGVKKKRIEEFDKAGIITKVIKFEQSDILKESISFPAFKFKEIADQDWEDSDFKNICESKFLFLIFQKTSYGEVFRGFKFWSMPYKDRVEAERVWQDTANKIKENNTSFLGMRDSVVAHVRPHGQNASDMDQLPNGGYFGKRSFWFNAKYIQSQVKIHKE